MKIDIGIADKGRKSVAEGLKQLLADSYALYLKTHNYHWNVTGPLFKSVHDLTEEQYLALATAIDEIAERIRMLGVKAPAGFKLYSDMSKIGDGDENASAEDMLKDLVKGHEAVIHTARSIRPSAEKAGDEGTVALIDDRMTFHEKQAWMLRSLAA